MNFQHLFDTFWNAGLRKINKKAAIKAFNKAIKGRDAESFVDMLVNDIQQRIELNQFGFDRLHPATYLNGERWEDEHKNDNRCHQSHADRQRQHAEELFRELESRNWHDGGGHIC